MRVTFQTPKLGHQTFHSPGNFPQVSSIKVIISNEIKDEVWQVHYGSLAETALSCAFHRMSPHQEQIPSVTLDVLERFRKSELQVFILEESRLLSKSLKQASLNRSGVSH